MSIREEKFELDLKKLKEDKPDWDKNLTDSTYFELMDWYDTTYHLGSEEINSCEAREFANYVWEKIHVCDTTNYAREKVHVCDTTNINVSRQSNDTYSLSDITENELRSLLIMIKGACLPERQAFKKVKEQIEEILGL